MWPVIIIGAGGHGQVVADILFQMNVTKGGFMPVGYIDDHPDLVGQMVAGLPVMGKMADLQSLFIHNSFIIAVGNNQTRKHIYEQLPPRASCATAKHPRAIVAPGVTIGRGSMVCAGAIVNPGSVVGDQVILNTGCTVDHHNFIGDFAHIAPGVHLGGDVEIGEGALIGIGATVMPQCRVGSWAVVGAGAVVHRDLPDGATAVGLPAKIISPKDNNL